MKIAFIADRIGALRSWRRVSLAIILGLLSAFAFPPYSGAPLLWLVYPILLWQLNGATSHRQTFLVGWAFGFGQFVFGFYWISVSMFTDIARWWWAVPFASTILPILLGFIPGFAAMMWGRMKLIGAPRVLIFAAWLMIGEWVRGHFLTGFPWNLTAHTWIAWLPILQSYSIIGAYGLGFSTIAAAALPSLFGVPNYPRRKAITFSAGGIALFAALALWGWHRIPTGPVATVPDIVVRLVQPNVPQNEKSSATMAEDRFVSLLRLSRQQDTGLAPNIIVWPETASPYALESSPRVPRAIARSLPKGGIAIVGALRRTRDGVGDWDYYNSMEIVDSDAQILAHYDKTHLAPFGEYMPFRSILHLDALAVGGDLTPGNGPTMLAAPGLPPLSPLICYEDIFPEQVVAPATRPHWLLQITNDGWFGASSGPYQHFAMARARAVEQGLPLLRAANTGISGAVDPYGRLLGTLPIGVQGVLDIALPQPLAAPPLYARYGDSLFAAMLAAAFILVFMKYNVRLVKTS